MYKGHLMRIPLCMVILLFLGLFVPSLVYPMKRVCEADREVVETTDAPLSLVELIARRWLVFSPMRSGIVCIHLHHSHLNSLTLSGLKTGDSCFVERTCALLSTS